MVVAIPEQITIPPDGWMKLVCLANSTKLGGRCVAGKQLIEGKVGPWIRPVSTPEGGSIVNPQYYRTSAPIAVMDVIELEVVKRVPYLEYQQENVLVKLSGWKKDGEYRWDKLHEVVDSPSPLWCGDGEKNDRIKLEKAQKLRSSLRLIKVTEPDIFVQYDGFRNVLRTRFVYEDVEHNLAITDPMAKEKYLGRSGGIPKFSEAYYCVSIGEPLKLYDGVDHCFKMVAAVIERPE